jgi:hypothetical protein
MHGIGVDKEPVREPERSGGKRGLRAFAWRFVCFEGRCQDGAAWFDVFHAFKLLELLRAWPLCDMHGIGVDKDPVDALEWHTRSGCD